ncbi:hypothetical protein M9H77_33225 [Catharanthus roseus]|uniref:Uncharacterized protein n=1 Tax=Catharanthus roseus TaxID=4058 RepID=A0ACB9ZIP4_CATRO|nr:hypothetical protein M9H77_33225 [Catharanthus roseus]
MPDRNVITWNTVICGLADSYLDLGSNFHPGFQYFKRMLIEIARPDWITFTGLFRICGEVNETEMSRVLHCLVLKLGLCKDRYISSALVDVYGKLGLVGEARRVFDHVVARDLVLWNVIVSCYSLNCLRQEAFKLYNLMRLEGFKGDGYTFTSLLNSCAGSGLCLLGREIHAVILKLCFDLDVVVGSSLVDMYAKNENLVEARKAFDGMPFRNVVSWTTLVVGYGQHGNGLEAIKLLTQMLREDFHPDELTLASILSSCGNLTMASEVTQAHAYIVKNGFSAYLSTANAMINAYFKCGSITCAWQSFSSITEPDILSWTSIIGAYAFHGLANEAAELFEIMLLNRVKPDGVAFLEVLSACSHGGLVKKGLHYFKLMVEVHRIPPDSKHYACLVDLLARQGLLEEAFDVLTSMPNAAESDALGAFLGSCKVYGNLELAEWASKRLFILEPNKPVNYTLMSNMYALPGRWFDVASVRKTMSQNCHNKAPGYSWLLILGKVSSFVSGDESHPETLKVYYMLGVLYETMKD